MASQSLNKLRRKFRPLNKTRQVPFFPWSCSKLSSFLFFFFLKKSVTRIDVPRKADLISPGRNRRFFFTKFDIPKKIKELGEQICPMGRTWQPRLMRRKNLSCTILLAASIFFLSIRNSSYLSQIIVSKDYHAWTLIRCVMR